jgi:hypothetical protein
MKITSLLVIAILISFQSLAQTFDVPKNYEFKTAADYAPYEKDLKKRKEVSAFVVAWINGSPNVNVEINETLVELDEKNPGMLVLYMARCARYVLESNYSTDMRAKHKAALRSMVAVYKNNKGINKDKKMDKLVKSEESGKLDEWLEENLKIQG